ncbi:hypothetical protein M9H77_18309 [Catharanthus roseus]|uniref:Uncharacterized protein n=1 Tax=Catharanthus roseus TaxID=4058 RepID=A0ACC0B752_CATRO|nr:hypothetical protein M9H77_18309 [Catharanthus roseus]
MVWPRARGGDDDLGLVTDRIGRVEGRAVTTSSRGVKERHSTSDISSTSALIGPVYDPYAHAPSLPIRIPSLDPTQYFSKTQIPLNEVSGSGLHLGAQFFEQLAGSVPVDSSYNGADYGATDCGNSLSDAGLGRDSSTSRSEEAVRIGSLRIHSGEDDEDKREDDGGHDDDDNGDGDSDDDEPVPVAQASSSGHRPAPDKGKGLTSSFMSLMSKIAGS